MFQPVGNFGILSVFCLWLIFCLHQPKIFKIRNVSLVLVDPNMARFLIFEAVWTGRQYYPISEKIIQK